jgi:hypothetical protein
MAVKKKFESYVACSWLRKRNMKHMVVKKSEACSYVQGCKTINVNDMARFYGWEREKYVLRTKHFVHLIFDSTSSVRLYTHTYTQVVAGLSATPYSNCSYYLHWT